MLDRIADLVRKSQTYYREGGINKFLQVATKFLKQKVEFYFILHPKIPPIDITIGRKRLQLAYNDLYIYNRDYKVVPGPSDTIIEAGVHRGRDTATLAKFGGEIIGFEPSQRNYSRAKKNLRRFDNIKLINKGLWKEKDKLELKKGEIQGDDGFINTDSTQIGTGKKVDVNSIDNFIEHLKIDEIDYLKIEAEGAEPEIIEGINEQNINNIVVNADEEREGKPVGKEIMKALQSMEYELAGIKKGHILFFTQEPIPFSAFRNEFN